MTSTDHCLTVAARAENAKNYMLQAETATTDGADFLRGQARSALNDVVREAQAALTILDLNGPQADLLERVTERGPTIVSGNELRTARVLERLGLVQMVTRESEFFGGGRQVQVLQLAKS